MPSPYPVNAAIRKSNQAAFDFTANPPETIPGVRIRVSEPCPEVMLQESSFMPQAG